MQRLHYWYLAAWHLGLQSRHHTDFCFNLLSSIIGVSPIAVVLLVVVSVVVIVVPVGVVTVLVVASVIP